MTSSTTIETFTFPPGMGVPPPAGAYAHATAVGETLYVTGQLPVDAERGALVSGGITEQTEQVLANLFRVLELTGSSVERVLQARSFLRHEDDFAAYDAVFRAAFPTRLPSRTTVAVSGFAIAGALVEIDLIALR
jgi:2-iminobutanoate/2-iminopropanoate deaminase